VLIAQTLDNDISKKKEGEEGGRIMTLLFH